MLLINQQWIQKELGKLYGEAVVRDIENINRLYRVYDGDGQAWEVSGGLQYKPNQTITNYIKTIIKAESRFMMSRAPEIKYVPANAESTEVGDKYDAFLTDVLNASRWQRKLIQAGRDCFIGKRVALKLTGGVGKPLRVDFRPAQEFVFDVADDDSDTLKKIVFFYQIMGDKVEEYDKSKQRIWCQRYEMQNGRCILDQGVFDGDGKPISDVVTAQDTGLDFIPCFVIINDGLTGDLTGESDVEMLLSNQDTYNHTNSDDADALRFNMFPMRYTIDASEESAAKVEIAPAAYADIASDPTGHGDNGKQAQIGILESTFSYDARVENRLNRTKSDMYAMLSVPNVSLEQLKGLAQSGKGMRGLYWELICRCNEKWAEGWDDALRWMAESLVKMARVYKAAELPELDYTVQIEHLYPIPEDEEDERLGDMSEVNAKVRSRLSYIDKWQPNADKEGELKQIAVEQAMLEDAYVGAIREQTTSPPEEA